MDSSPINPVRSQKITTSEDSYTLTLNLKKQMDDFHKNLSLFVNNPDYVNQGTVQEFSENVQNLHATCSQIENSSMVSGPVSENAQIMKKILEGSFLVES
jgi:hypothetical protein